jgi:transposase-like protein
MRKLVKQYGEPRVLITDKLGSYGSAKRNLIAGVEHRQHKGLNNKAEVSHRQVVSQTFGIRCVRSMLGADGTA